MNQYLKENIDNYMKRKNIKKYSQVLYMIGKQLNVPDVYEFSKKERYNFSKMLKGERPLKNEFIIPLEKIFGVSLSRLLDEDAYKLPIEKENILLIKGIRYYAWKDDYNLYKNEAESYLHKDGSSMFMHMDEFGKSIIDYLIEYQSVNGIRYLYDTYDIKYNGYFNQLDFNNKTAYFMPFDTIGFARLVVSMNDVDMFNNIFDTYKRFVTNGHFGENTIFMSYDFFEIILDNELIFDSLFEEKEYTYKFKDEVVRFSSINPIINGVLNCSLKNLSKYKNQALKILKYGMNNNKKIVEYYQNNFNNFPHMDLYIDFVGALKEYKNNRPIGILITVGEDNMDIIDEDIKDLIETMPYIEELRRE